MEEQKSIRPEDFAALDFNTVTLLDLREPDEVLVSGVRGAINIPFAEIGKKLNMVDQAEQFLLDLGFRQVRVRIHGMIARIEIFPGEFRRILDDDVRQTIYRTFREIGFSYVTLDLLGYRTGSMNETLR